MAAPGKPRMSEPAGRGGFRGTYLRNSGGLHPATGLCIAGAADPAPHGDGGAVQRGQLGGARRCACCSVGHPGTTHVGPGSSHNSVERGTGAATCSLPQSRRGRRGQGRHACQPAALGSASRSHVGPRCPGWTLSRSTSAPPRAQKAAASRSWDRPGWQGRSRGGRCQRQRNAASCDSAVPACRVLLRATLGTQSTAARKG